MRTYSVWNYGTRSYDYYTAPGTSETHAGSPPIGGAALGATPEQASWPLPAGARKVGSGALPKGRIAAPSSSKGIALGSVDITSPTTIAVAVLAYIAWKHRKAVL